MALRRFVGAVSRPIFEHRISIVAEARSESASSAQAFKFLRRELKVHSPHCSGSFPVNGKEVIYRCSWIRPIRLLVRLKLLQLCGIGLAMVPISTQLAQETMNGKALLVSSAVLLGTGVASFAMWYCSRRFVGELSLIDARKRLLVSTLDFWGNRHDEDISVGSIIPSLPRQAFSDPYRKHRSPLVRMEVTGGRQYMVAWRLNSFPEDLLLRLLGGTEIHGIGK